MFNKEKAKSLMRPRQQTQTRMLALNQRKVFVFLMAFFLEKKTIQMITQISMKKLLTHQMKILMKLEPLSKDYPKLKKMNV
jgi:hypothetical protein